MSDLRTPPHVTGEGAICWCEPQIIRMRNGWCVFVHRSADEDPIDVEREADDLAAEFMCFDEDGET